MPPDPSRLDRRTLNRTLLGRQMLLERSRRSVDETIEHLVGMQSQVPLDPFVGLWSRLDGFDPGELDALMLERRAVRTSLMRTTLHLATARDALTLWPLFRDVLARTFQAQRQFREGVLGVDLDALLEVGTRLLEERPMTTAELRRSLGERWPEAEPAALAMAIRYHLPTVQVTPRGLWRRSMQPTLTTLHAWLGREVDAVVSPDAAILRYLGAFGPASVADIRTWSWLKGVREVVDRLRPRLRTFRDESGRELLDLPDAPMVSPDVPAPPRFLPEYDNAFLSHEDRSRISGPWYAGGAPGSRGPLLVDGFVVAGWRIERQAHRATLIVDLFVELSASDRAGVEEEGHALLAFSAADAETRDVELRVG